MENDETLEAGAAREAVEEAQIEVEIGSLLLLANVTSARQVHVFFRSRMLTPHFGITHESLEVRLIDENEIPVGSAGVSQHRVRLAAFRRGPCRGRGPASRRRNAAPVLSAK